MGLAGTTMLPRRGRAAIPPPLPQFGVAGGTSAPTSCGSISPPSPARPYSTTFSLTENPIREGGNWVKQTPNIPPGVHSGWHSIKTSGVNAAATANAGSETGGPGSGDYDDAYAYLSGTWAANQECEATIYRGSGTPREVELLLRCSDSTTQVRTYECGFTVEDGWCFFARWNGAQDDFTILVDSASGLRTAESIGPFRNGDRVRARNVGQTLTAWYARAATPTVWVQIGTYMDNSADKLTSGAPGIGFFSREGNSLHYGFSDFVAREPYVSGGENRQRLRGPKRQRPKWYCSVAGQMAQRLRWVTVSSRPITLRGKLGRQDAFTLIELLIVVAIIGILAAIAVPNFLNAQIRAKVARATADMRNISVGFEAYHLDKGQYPMGRLKGRNPEQAWGWGFLPEDLTTPVAYLSNLPTDEFNVNYRIYGHDTGEDIPKGHPHTRYRTARQKAFTGEGAQFGELSWKPVYEAMVANIGINLPYILVSPGPDKTEDILPSYNPHAYMPSNGLMSSGDIVYSNAGVQGGGSS
jgi:type II secretion system protein G